MKRKNNQREFKNGLSFFINYVEKYNVSIHFKVALYDMILNCIRTNNVISFRSIINTLHKVSVKQEFEKNLLLSLKKLT